MVKTKQKKMDVGFNKVFPVNSYKETTLTADA